MAGRTKKRIPRLGRGLSSLMATPVQVQPPETAPPPPEVASPRPTTAELVPTEFVSRAETGLSSSPKPQASSLKPAASPRPLPPSPGEGLRYLSVEAIRPNPHQPRQQIDDVGINLLSASIKADGLM